MCKRTIVSGLGQHLCDSHYPDMHFPDPPTRPRHATQPTQPHHNPTESQFSTHISTPDTGRPHEQQKMKTQMSLAAVAAFALGAQAFIGTPLAGAPKAKVCSSTTRMAVALAPLPCK